MNAIRRAVQLCAVSALAALAIACDSERPSEPVLTGVAVDSTGAPVAGASIGVVYRFGAPPSKVAATPVPVIPPGQDSLYQNVPNPFERSTRLMFAIRMSQSMRLVVESRDRRAVRVLMNQNLVAGLHIVAWDGRDDSGAPVTPGAYIARLETAGQAGGREIRIFSSNPDLDALVPWTTTDAAGRFTLPLASFDVGEIVPMVDDNGVATPPQVVSSRIELCASVGLLRRACVDVDLGDRHRSVAVTIPLP